MKKLNEKGLSIVELIVTFALIMIIVSGLLTIIMNYRGRMQSELKRLDLVSYKNTLTKDIQNDIINKGLDTINYEGECLIDASQYSNCVNIVFKDGIEKILATSKVELEDGNTNLNELRNLLNNKFIKYGDIKYTIKDKLPSSLPEGGNFEQSEMIYFESQEIRMIVDNLLSVDTVQLSDNSFVKIYSIDISLEHIDYSDDFGIHIVATDNNILNANSSSQEFAYNGENEQVYKTPASGTYKIEAWGASGADYCLDPTSDDDKKCIYSGGLGSYVSGYTYLPKDTTLYLHVGGAGIPGNTVGGYNGGGNVLNASYASVGGGATDIRLVSGTWDSFEGLKSRILVAAGGGGASNRNRNVVSGALLFGSGDGGAGGGVIGYDGSITNYKNTHTYNSFGYYGLGLGGTQNSGGITKVNNSDDNSLTPDVSFISGGFGKSTYFTPSDKLSVFKSSGVTGTVDDGFVSGPGGGWFTGGIGINTGSGGGSSYISGHVGCLAISESSLENNVVMKSDSEFKNYHFDSTVIIDGEGYSWSDIKQNQKTMPSYPGKTGDLGNKGNGYIKITYIGA